MSKAAPAKNQDELVVSSTRLVAFYLPQFHQIPENDAWWGEGFTEWRNVAQAKPNFEGHYQPKVPRELGFYDLTVKQHIEKQVKLAKEHGISGFAYYYYWFNGERLLEKPLDLLVKNKSIDIDFCLVWANENWTKNWDGGNRELLKVQSYESGWEKSFVADLKPYLADSRYIRVDGKPLLVIYRVKDIPNLAASVANIRKQCKAQGVGEVHIAGVDFYDVKTTEGTGLDSLIEFPPHKFNTDSEEVKGKVELYNKADFSGNFIDYKKVIAKSTKRKKPDFKLFRAAMPDWDNTARRQNSPTTTLGSTPELFYGWLTWLRIQQDRDNWSKVKKADDQLIFINAWNEWAEGAALEPNLKWGKGYLEACQRSGFYRSSSSQARVADLIDLLRDDSSVDLLTRPKSEKPNLKYRVSKALVRFPLLRSIARQVYRLVRK